MGKVLPRLLKRLGRFSSSLLPTQLLHRLDLEQRHTLYQMLLTEKHFPISEEDLRSILNEFKPVDVTIEAGATLACQTHRGREARDQ